MKVLVSVLLDESGSMAPVGDKVIAGFNDYVAGLRKGDKGMPVEVTLTCFDTRAVRTVFRAKPLAEVPPLTATDYQPGAGTPLYDAFVCTVAKVAQEAGENPVLFVTFTDGEENSSKEYTRDQVIALIAEREKKGWTFVYLGANQDAWAVGTRMGYSGANTRTYHAGDPVAAWNVTLDSSVYYMAHTAKRMAMNVAAQAVDINFKANLGDYSVRNFFADKEEEKKNDGVATLSGTDNNGLGSGVKQ